MRKSRETQTRMSVSIATEATLSEGDKLQLWDLCVWSIALKSPVLLPLKDLSS